MAVMLIAQNETRESGSFMGDQLCSLKTAYLFVENEPDVDKVIMSVSPGNEMAFLWQKFIDKYNVELVYDTWNPGDWEARFVAWNKWRKDREIEGRKFDKYRELYLRIHGSQRQTTLCGFERGLGRRNIYEYWLAGQENMPDTFKGADCFDDSLVYHPSNVPERDVWISPHAKTQGNITFTFDYWSDVVHKLIDAGVTVTVGYDGYFCEDLVGHPLYKKHWGTHKQWMEQLCRHKIVACGNTGTGWLAAACGIPMITAEPSHSQMPDHRYRECGLRNLVEVMDTPDADYCARRLIEEVQRVVVMTTGCYDVLHAGHVRHLEKSKSLGTRLIVALNSDDSVRRLKGPDRPIVPQGQRKAVLEALRCVDEVRVFDGNDAIPLIKEIKPDILTAGFGYTLATAPYNDTVVGRSVVEEWGGRVVVTYQGDASNEPSTSKIVKRILRSTDVIEVCRMASSYSVNGFDKLKLMADEFLKTVDLPGDVADLGAYRGGTSLILRRLAPDKQLHLFDTWDGTPFNDDLCHHKKGEWKADVNECRKLVGGLNGSSITHYYKGVFPYTARELVVGSNGRLDIATDRQFCFVYIDPDTYQTVRDAIDFFWPRLVKGGKLFFDDYGWTPCAGVKKAVDEVFPPEEDRYKDLPGVGIRHVVEPQYTCIITKR